MFRIFAARLKPGVRSEYERLCRDGALPQMREQPSFLSARIEQVREDRRKNFVLISLWSAPDSIQAFVAECWREAFILCGEVDLLEEVSVRHFDESFDSLVAMWYALADVVKRRELSVEAAPLNEAQSQHIKPLLPLRAHEGRPRADDRRTLEGILYVLRAGCRWRDLPAKYGSPDTCWRRYRQWESDGTWERIWRQLFATLDARGHQAWALAFLDSRCVPSRAGKDFLPTAPRHGRIGTLM